MWFQMKISYYSKPQERKREGTANPQIIPDLQPRVPYQGIFQEEPELEIDGID